MSTPPVDAPALIASPKPIPIMIAEKKTSNKPLVKYKSISIC